MSISQRYAASIAHPLSSIKGLVWFGLVSVIIETPCWLETNVDLPSGSVVFESKIKVKVII